MIVFVTDIATQERVCWELPGIPREGELISKSGEPTRVVLGVQWRGDAQSVEILTTDQLGSTSRIRAQILTEAQWAAAQRTK